MKKLFIWLIIAVALVLVPLYVVRAQNPPPTQTPTPPSKDDLTAFLSVSDTSPIFKLMVLFGYALGITGIVYAGVLYLSAFGSEERPGLAKKAITAVITGIVIIVLSRVIVYSIVPADQSTSIVNTGLS